jgi:raffinose/stachyose/melibiose transport system permease protein
MAAPALFSVGFLLAIGYWNDYFTIYMYAPEKATIAYGVQRIADQNSKNLPQVFASLLFSMLPVLIIFACFQRTIMANTTVGGIKG